MILTCPDCATSYFVDEARIPPEGRVVKCSSCGSRWRAEREASAAVPPPPEPVHAREAEPEPEPEAFVPIVDDIVAEPAPAVVVEEAEIVAAPVRRKPPVQKPKARPKRAGAVIAWAAVAATVAAVVGAVVFREQVARTVPGSAAVFAAIGLPTDELGLKIDQVRSVATLQGGRPVLAITGAIRNTREQTVASPPLRVSILDRAGQPVAAKIARPLNAEIPPGGTRYFAISIPDPPAGSASLDIIFEPPSATSAAAAEPDVDAKMGPAPIEPVPAPDVAEAVADHG